MLRGGAAGGHTVPDPEAYDTSNRNTSDDETTRDKDLPE